MPVLETQPLLGGSKPNQYLEFSEASKHDADVKTVQLDKDGTLTTDDVVRIADSIVFTSEAESRLVRKFDLRILPCLATMYLFNSLDKTSMGNAKTAGLEKSLGLHNNQFNLLLSIFYIPYVLAAPLLGIVGKKYGPSRVLPLMMAAWGIISFLIALVKNFPSFMMLRVFLGLAESAFFPLVIYYQTLFYRRGELARRLGLFYAAGSIAPALGGLVAFGTFQIRNGPLASWRYLFLFEGSGSFLFALFAYWCLPYNAESAKFLTKEEKNLAWYRMQVDSSAVVDTKFVFGDAIKILKHPTSWVILVLQMCVGVPLQAVALFLPVIVSCFGYSAVKTNLYTVLPNLSGAIMLLALCFASDHTKLRFPFLALGFAFTCIGFVIFACVDIQAHLNIAYFSCFMMTWGTGAPSVILNVWANNNIADESKRVLLTSVGVPLANLMGLVASNIFRAQDAPKYLPALITTAAFGATGCFLTLVLGNWMALDNKRRDAKQGRKLHAQEIPTDLLAAGPASDDYRWFL